MALTQEEKDEILAINHRHKPKRFYGKLYCEEGVLAQHGFDTEAEAQAYVSGLNDAIEALDPDDDFHSTCVDDKAATDEEAWECRGCGREWHTDFQQCKNCGVNR